MKPILRPSVVLLAMAAALGSCTVTAETEKAHGVNLSQYKTFQWASPSTEKHADGMMDQDIRDDVAAGLQQKGLTAAANADLIVDYRIGSFRGYTQQAEAVYTHPYTSYWIGPRGRIYSYWNPSYESGTRYHNVPFTENVLSVNLKDAKSGRMVWEGRAETDMTNHSLTAKQAQKDIAILFKHFG